MNEINFIVQWTTGIYRIYYTSTRNSSVTGLSIKLLPIAKPFFHLYYGSLPFLWALFYVRRYSWHVRTHIKPAMEYWHTCTYLHTHIHIHKAGVTETNWYRYNHDGEETIFPIHPSINFQHNYSNQKSSPPPIHTYVHIPHQYVLTFPTSKELHVTKWISRGSCGISHYDGINWISRKSNMIGPVIVDIIIHYSVTK